MKIGDMRDLSDDFKLSVRSAGEVLEALGGMVARNKTTGEVQFRGKSLTREVLVNAALLHLASLPEAERIQALANGVDRLEALMRGEAIAPARAGPGTLAVQAQAEVPEAKPKRKRG